MTRRLNGGTIYAHHQRDVFRGGILGHTLRDYVVHKHRFQDSRIEWESPARPTVGTAGSADDVHSLL